MAQMFKFVRVHVRKYPVSEVEDGGGGEHQDRYSAAKAGEEAGEVNPDQSLQKEDNGGKDLGGNRDTVEDSKDADRNNLGDDERIHNVREFHVRLINL